MDDGWVTGWGPDLVPGWAAAAGGDGDGDAAFDNSGHVPGAGALLADLSARSAAFRQSLGARARLDLAYGGHPRAALDLFLPESVPEGLLVCLHGGYWQRSGREDWSVLAAGALARGHAVAIPSYPLAPDATMPRITGAAARAVAHAAALVAGPIRVAGHSAGGHLAARMACGSGPLPASVAARLVRVTSISGLHDLRPLRAARAMNGVLHLDAQTACNESPALCAPRPGIVVRAVVGARERPELIRQTRILGAAWGDMCACSIIPREDHFTIVTGLIDPACSLTEEVLGSQDCEAATNLL